jgi:hypothetical protein
MGTFTVLAGDFPKFGPTVPHPSIEGATLLLPRPSRKLLKVLEVASPREEVPASEVASLEVVGQVSGKSFGGAAVAGLAGGLVLGPVGLVAGALAGGSKDAVSFELTLRDGRRLLGSAKSTAFQELQAALFAAGVRVQATA